MMIDTSHEFSYQQAVTATVPSTNVSDLKAEGEALDELYYHVVLNEAFDNLTSLKIDLETDTVVGFGSAVVLHTETFLPAALTPAGTKLITLRMPRGAKRFARINFTLVGSTPTTGKIDAFLSPSLHDDRYLT